MWFLPAFLSCLGLFYEAVERFHPPSSNINDYRRNDREFCAAT